MTIENPILDGRGIHIVFRKQNTRVVPVNRGLYSYIKNLMSQNNKTLHIYQILYNAHNK